MGVKDWAKAIEQVSTRVSETRRTRMGARVANSGAFAKFSVEGCFWTRCSPRIFTDDADQRTDNGKGEMRGFLHSATHDETVSDFGRNDEVFGARYRADSG
jgi:hypothetical protein